MAHKGVLFLDGRLAVRRGLSVRPPEDSVLLAINQESAKVRVFGVPQ